LPRLPRRARIALGLVAALLLAIVLIAPVAFRGSGGKPCAKTIAFQGSAYTARAASSFVQSIAIGVGIASGCGVAPANVSVRSVTGIAPARAIALATDTSTIYVKRGICSGVSRTALLACLR
jgi:hypothetical protein